MIKFAPSILSANFANLKDEILAIKISGSEYVHLDIMDGNFVPNITIGSPVIEALRPLTDLVFDVHLMVVNPQNHIEKFANAGADIITIHAEASLHLHRDICFIKSLGKKAGVAINPATPIEVLEYVLEEVDMILIMSVNPGFGGQKFIEFSIDKIQKLKTIIDKKNLNIDIEVDGGINKLTAKEVIDAGANVLVSGLSFFEASNKTDFVNSIKGNLT